MNETATHRAPTPIPADQRELLDQVLDKWSLAVLDKLCDSPHRFNDLRRALPAVSQKSLTVTLRRLERNGMVERQILSDRPVAVEYRMSALGKSLRGLIEALIDWAGTAMPEVERSRKRFDELHGS